MNIYELKCIEDEIISYINRKKKVYIESGAANDSIDNYEIQELKPYSWQSHSDREVTFSTSACIFPEQVQLSYWDNIETEEYNGALFVKVW